MKAIKHFFRFSLALVSIGVFSTSCMVSAPRTHHVPLFEEKGEMQVAANANIYAGGEIQVDYAVGKRTYLMTDFSYSFPEISDAFGNAKGYYGTLGVGRFRTYGKYGRFGFYGGGTAGKIVFTNNSDFHLTPFLGVDWGMARPKFETALSFKLAQNWITDGDQYVTYEPAWTTRFGGERFKYQTQLGFVVYGYEFPEFQFMASFGFTYRLRTIKK